MNSTGISPVQVPAIVDQAAQPIPLLWPLGSAVAANPLWDLRDQPFDAAVARARQVLGIAGLPPAGLLADAFRAGRITTDDLIRVLEDRSAPEGDEAPGPPETIATTLEHHDRLTGGEAAVAVDREVSKYCAAHLAGLLPEPEGGRPGFFASWRAVAGVDPGGRRLGLAGLLPELGRDPEAVIATVLSRLGLSASEAVVELTGQMARQPGWAAHAKWRSQWAAPDHPGPALQLMDYLAVRLAYDAAALDQVGHRAGKGACCGGTPRAVRTPLPAPSPGLVGGPVGRRLARLGSGPAGLVWLAAYESHYRDRLLAALDRPGSGRPVTIPAAQVVFCIDTRSEGMRRHLEALGDYQTFGFAGFFGIAARVWPLGSDEPLDLCPVLLRPAVEVTETAEGTAGGPTLTGIQQLAGIRRALDRTRKDPVGTYLLAEASGLGLGPLAVLRTSAPTLFARLRQGVGAILTPPVDAAPDLEGPGSPDDAEQALYAEASLRAMGLTEGFAPVVMLCGHGSTTENNPYASALDCGACGAARGARSARLAASVCNRPAVRALLAERGILIPDQTVFVAAEHDTATDTVTVFTPARLDPQTRTVLGRIETDLSRAGVALAAERAATLPGAPRPSRRRSGRRHVAVRSADWAQVQPEWGLARCAAFVVAPRRFTAGVDLERRVFLHSYEPDRDADGVMLESILAGPMVVAHWISAAYYHSTVDPGVLGAGDKVAHNVVAGVGVHQGAGGDLKLGLPRQAVFDRDTAYHEPMRLLVVIAAPRDRIDAVVGRVPVLAQLAGGAWVNLVARDGERFWLRRPEGAWDPWRLAAPPAAGGPDPTGYESDQ